MSKTGNPFEPVENLAITDVLELALIEQGLSNSVDFYKSLLRKHDTATDEQKELAREHLQSAQDLLERVQKLKDYFPRLPFTQSTDHV